MTFNFKYLLPLLILISSCSTSTDNISRQVANDTTEGSVNIERVSVSQGNIVKHSTCKLFMTEGLLNYIGATRIHKKGYEYILITDIDSIIDGGLYLAGDGEAYNKGELRVDRLTGNLAGMGDSGLYKSKSDVDLNLMVRYGDTIEPVSSAIAKGFTYFRKDIDKATSRGFRRAFKEIPTCTLK